MEAAEANVCRGGLQNESEELESFTGQWRLLSAWRDAGAEFITKNWVAVQLKRSAHFVQRKWHRSPHDLQTEFRGSGHWFSLKKVMILWVRAVTVILAQAGCVSSVAAAGGHTEY